MDAQSLAIRVNPRIVARTSPDLTADILELAGVGGKDARTISAHSDFAVMSLDAVDEATARLVRESMACSGGSACAAPRSLSEKPGDRSMVLVGSRHEYRAFLKDLGERPGGADFADLLARTLDDYNRDRFRLKVRSGEVVLAKGTPLIMGILNVTPDSFSDGGAYPDTKAAVERGLKMAGEGAGIIDVGGESTRPGSAGATAGEEAARVLPVIKALAAETDCPISIDTSKAAVAEGAIEAGAALINDVTALSGDADMVRVAADTGCPVILMHMKGTPRTMQKSPFYRDLMGEITLYLRQSIARAVEGGVDVEQTVIDPGIGFGKTVGHNLEIMRRLKEFSSLGRPILIGPSRKSFIGKMLDVPVEERLPGTAAAVALAAASGAHIIRVHDVREMRQCAVVAAGIAAGESSEVP